MGPSQRAISRQSGAQARVALLRKKALATGNHGKLRSTPRLVERNFSRLGAGD
jgi:hypothetical protein